MELDIKKILKSSLISLAVLGMVGGSFNGTASAKRRYHSRTHRVYRHHIRRGTKRGYWKTYRRHGRTRRIWVRYTSHKAQRRTKRYTRRNKRAVKPVRQRRQVRHISKPTYSDGLTIQQNKAVFDGEAHPGKFEVNLVFGSTHPSKAAIQHYFYLNPISGDSDSNTSNSNNNSNSEDANANSNDSKGTNVAQNLAEMKSQTLTDINNDRAEVNAPALNENDKLNNLAQMRAQQLTTKYSHFDNNGNIYANEDASKLGYSPYIWDAENIDQTRGSNGYEAANNANYAFWNNEKGVTPSQDGGHRKNIEGIAKHDLNGNYDTNVGIGTAYNNGNYYVSEDFGSVNN